MKSVDILATKDDFFNILAQTELSQVGVMTLQPNQASGGLEAHSGDQIIYCIQGKGVATVEESSVKLHPGILVIIPAHSKHQIKNNSSEILFFMSIYTPPQY
jgi:quercetin dioxygenase-like cupin family protein